jgi:hypothetical protein
VDDKTALNVVQKTEVLARLLNSDNIYLIKFRHIIQLILLSKRTHVAGWVGGVRANLAVHLDQSLSDDRCDLTIAQGIFKAVA